MNLIRYYPTTSYLLQESICFPLFEFNIDDKLYEYNKYSSLAYKIITIRYLNNSRHSRACYKNSYIMWNRDLVKSCDIYEGDQLS